MKRYVIIPCRYDSSRLPGKVLLDLFGRPLIQWVYEGVLEAKLVDDVFVATDDRRIEEACRKFGARVIFTRSDHKSGTDRVAEACFNLGCDESDIIVNVQGDEPLVTGQMVDLLVEALLKNHQISMATLAFRSSFFEDFQNPNVVKVVCDKNMRALYFSRASIPFNRDGWKEGSFWKHQGFYAYRYGFLKKFTAIPQSELEQCEKLEQLRVLEHGYSILVVPSPKDTIGIDTAEDVEQFKNYVRKMGFQATN
ncbi:MAG: 3-deoxy-manno-octulosonate cytidylyltransferase [Thermodesulforhabdaceae bacterium]